MVGVTWEKTSDRGGVRVGLHSEGRGEGKGVSAVWDTNLDENIVSGIGFT